MDQQKLGTSTLEQIAAIAGVSRSTVSRVLNNDPNVKASTRSDVLAVMARERFVPNRSARGLAMGRTGMIGIVMSVDLGNFFSDPFFAALLQATYAAAREHELVLSLWLPDGADHSGMIDQVARGAVLDGVILAAETATDPIVEELSESGKPFVLLGRSATHEDVSYVDVDNKAAARAATNHLLRLGRTRVATIAGPAFSVAGTDRLAGYHAALDAAGAKTDRSLIYEGDFGAASAVLGTRLLVTAGADAIVAANDVMAIAAIAELNELGIRVPEDVAVVGFDDLPAAREVDPPLTTVRQSIPDLATEALRVLTELIADPARPPARYVVATELIVRTSCGVHLPPDKPRKEN